MSWRLLIEVADDTCAAEARVPQTSPRRARVCPQLSSTPAARRRLSGRREQLHSRLSEWGRLPGDAGWVAAVREPLQNHDQHPSEEHQRLKHSASAEQRPLHEYPAALCTSGAAAFAGWPMAAGSIRRSPGKPPDPQPRRAGRRSATPRSEKALRQPVRRASPCHRPRSDRLPERCIQRNQRLQSDVAADATSVASPLLLPRNHLPAGGTNPRAVGVISIDHSAGMLCDCGAMVGGRGSVPAQ